MVTLYILKKLAVLAAGGLVVIEHARQGDDPGSSPPTLPLLHYLFQSLLCSKIILSVWETRCP